MSVNMPNVAARPFAAPRPLLGIGASAVALLLCLAWHPAWMAPLLIIALSGVWIF
jgi:methyl-accepting chemotaxis protein